MKKLYWQVLALTVAMLGFATAQANTTTGLRTIALSWFFQFPRPDLSTIFIYFRLRRVPC